jgi:hypothetical protein
VHVLQSPAGVADRHDRAELDGVGVRAGVVQHPRVDGPGVHRQVAAHGDEVEHGVRAHREHGALDAGLAAQQGPDDPDRLDGRGARPGGARVGLAEVLQVPQRRPDAEPHAAAGGLVEGGGLHRDHGGVPVERVDDAEPDRGPGGRRGEQGGQGEDAAVVPVLVGPQLVEAELLGEPGVREVLRDRAVVLQRDPEPGPSGAHASLCRPRPEATRLMYP